MSSVDWLKAVLCNVIDEIYHNDFFVCSVICFADLQMHWYITPNLCSVIFNRDLGDGGPGGLGPLTFLPSNIVFFFG